MKKGIHDAQQLKKVGIHKETTKEFSSHDNLKGTIWDLPLKLHIHRKLVRTWIMVRIFDMQLKMMMTCQLEEKLWLTWFNDDFFRATTRIACINIAWLYLQANARESTGFAPAVVWFGTNPDYRGEESINVRVCSCNVSKEQKKRKSA